MASHCTRAQGTSDPAWPPLGASKPFPTFSPKCGHDQVPMTNRIPDQSFLITRSFSSQSTSNVCFQNKRPPAGGTKGGRGCLRKRILRERQLVQGLGTGSYDGSLPRLPQLDSLPGTTCSLPSYSDSKCRRGTSKETKTKKRPRKKEKKKREREEREGEVLGGFQNNLHSLRCFLFKKKMKEE